MSDLLKEYNCPICDKICELNLFSIDCNFCIDKSVEDFFEILFHNYSGLFKELLFTSMVDDLYISLRHYGDGGWNLTLGTKNHHSKLMTYCFTMDQVSKIDFSKNNLKEQIEKKIKNMLKLIEMKNFK